MSYKSKIENAIKQFPKRCTKIITYGTSGYRARGEELDHVLVRMGILAALRSMDKNGLFIGLMVTASHNPEEDNGFKTVDPYGEMLELSWEALATEIGNCDDNALVDWVTNWLDKHEQSNIAPKVMMARDTRITSELLAQAARAGAEAMGAEVVDHGVATTPMLHYFVAGHNTGSVVKDHRSTYIKALAEPFNSLRQTESKRGNYVPELIFDGANGVGAIAIKEFVQQLSNLKVTVVNDDTISKRKLNYKCGSDHVKTTQGLPDGLSVQQGQRCVSVDGDADRLVYYFLDKSGTFCLLDGDRIASLVAGYLKELLNECKLDLELGLVQTAYANGNSTKYISESLGINVACVETGVKHLHHKAEEYDIGIYFEANGHGTVLFSKKANQAIDSTAFSGSVSGVRLKLLRDMVNYAVGDAISDLLLVESILLLRGWSCEDWYTLYQDLPNRLVKVIVKDRNCIKTKNAARECIKPDGLQAEITRLSSQVSCGRSFVRPSGTEDVVRVYAEAQSQGQADWLAAAVSAAVYKMAGGEGPEPVIPPHCSL